MGLQAFVRSATNHISYYVSALKQVVAIMIPNAIAKNYSYKARWTCKWYWSQCIWILLFDKFKM